MVLILWGEVNYFWKYLRRNLLEPSFLLDSNENVTMWICNIFLLVRTISSKRIMSRPMVFSVTIKIIVSAVIAFGHAKQRPIAIVLIRWKPWWDQLVTWASYVFDDRTVDITFLPIYHAAISTVCRVVIMLKWSQVAIRKTCKTKYM